MILTVPLLATRLVIRRPVLGDMIGGVVVGLFCIVIYGGQQGGSVGLSIAGLLVFGVAFVIVYTYRARRRLKIAWARIWPSPGMALLFAGAVILFGFSLLVGHEPLWMSILGDSYKRVAKLAVEEFIELIGYFLWLVGTIEYTYEARAIAFKQPRPLAQRLREQRRRLGSGKR